MAEEDVIAGNPWVQRAGLDADAMGGGTRAVTGRGHLLAIHCSSRRAAARHPADRGLARGGPLVHHRA